ncbi:MAG TPA: DUF4232 domain-containing protein [Gammaproteobacteria bacterium]|nr:DUF4232 domain-containing protein [Gammaproteobacteria bacterium]
MVRGKIPQIGLLVTGALAAVVLAGCGESGNTNAQPGNGSGSASPSQSSTDSGGATANPPAGAQPVQSTPDNGLCKSTDLDISLGRGDGAAGTVYRPLTFKNVSDHECTIQGFAGVSYVGGADGHQIGAAAFRNGEKGAAIKLAKGQSASADVGFVNVQNFEPTTCQPQPARGIRVYPPQETASKFVEIPNATACANDKIPGNQLTVKTVVKG